MDPEILARILKLSETLAVCRYVNTAGAAAWFYDFILTISTEHKYIWKRKWSLVKALYLINRYLTPPFLILVIYHLDGEQRGPLSTQFCIFYDIIATLLRGVQLVASTWLVLIVVQSLSLNNRCLKFFLYAMFCTMNIAVTVFGIITLKEIYPTIVYFDALKICASIAPESTRWLYMAQVPFDLLLLSIELFYYWRLQRMVAPARLTKLLSAMYLDGVSYFVATFSIKLGAAFVIIFADPGYWYVATSADQAFTSIFVARLVLHLRVVASAPSDSTYAYTSTSYSKSANTGPTITVTMAGDQTEDNSRLENGVRSHDSDSVCKTREDGNELWKSGDADALEMQVPKRIGSEAQSLLYN